MAEKPELNRLERIETEYLAPHPLPKQLLVELIGTFFLVMVAAGAPTIGAYVGGQIGRGAATVAPGLLVMAMIYALGPISGLHINPAVTVAFWSRGVFPSSRVPGYIVAQLLGACAAALFLRAMFGPVGHLGATIPNAQAGDIRSLIMEVVLTMTLVTVILGTATGPKSVGHNAAIAVGGTVALLGLFASPISGASMNPARSLGPDIVRGDLTASWIYIVGPIAGALIAVGLDILFRGLPSKSEREAAQGLITPPE